MHFQDFLVGHEGVVLLCELGVSIVSSALWFCQFWIFSEVCIDLVDLHGVISFFNLVEVLNVLSEILVVITVHGVVLHFDELMRSRLEALRDQILV